MAKTFMYNDHRCLLQQSNKKAADEAPEVQQVRLVNREVTRKSSKSSFV